LICRIVKGRREEMGYGRKKEKECLKGRENQKVRKDVQEYIERMEGKKGWERVVQERK
jgi:hypothetical protein